jgi:large subunit ribosomal protein L35
MVYNHPMPKIKTHKGTAKRVKITASGKLIRERAFGNHILAKKSKSRKRHIKTAATIKGKTARNIKTSLGT